MRKRISFTENYFSFLINDFNANAKDFWPGQKIRRDKSCFYTFKMVYFKVLCLWCDIQFYFRAISANEKQIDITFESAAGSEII